MSRREKRSKKKGISLVGFLIILIALVCVEGIYIVKLKGEDSLENANDELVATNDANSNIEPSKTEATKEVQTENVGIGNSINGKIVISAGYDFNIMLDAILDEVEKQAEAGNVVGFIDATPTETPVNVQEMKEKRTAYKTVLINNLDGDTLINYVKYEKGQLSCGYNMKRLLNLIGLESNAYTELGADESFNAVYNFN